MGYGKWKNTVWAPNVVGMVDVRILRLRSFSAVLYLQPFPPFLRYGIPKARSLTPFHTHVCCHIMASEACVINSLSTYVLEKPPSCIEFLPLDHDFCVIGTYCLDTGDGQEECPRETDQATNVIQSRNGSLILFNLNETKPYACIPIVVTL